MYIISVKKSKIISRTKSRSSETSVWSCFHGTDADTPVIYDLAKTDSCSFETSRDISKYVLSLNECEP